MTVSRANSLHRPRKHSLSHVHIRRRLLIAWLVCFTCSTASAGAPQHYVFLNRDRERIADAQFLATPALAGAQIKYVWRELETSPDDYDFSPIREDLRDLKSHGKQLFIQLQDVSFDPQVILVPAYLRTDPRYHGGASQQYENADDEAQAQPGGWVARRWDPAVRDRFHILLAALGREFDGQIAGIVLPETAVEFGESGRLYPEGFTPEKYRDGILANLAALKRAFPKSVTIQYANFMPGEWLPDNNRGHLQAVITRCRELKVGVGGPDLLPYQPAQMKHAYRFLPECAGQVPIGIAVQEGNYVHISPRHTRPLTITELVEFATRQLKADYLFWCTEEPYYSQQLLPYLKSSHP